MVEIRIKFELISLAKCLVQACMCRPIIIIIIIIIIIFKLKIPRVKSYQNLKQNIIIIVNPRPIIIAN